MKKDAPRTRAFYIGCQWALGRAEPTDFTSISGNHGEIQMKKSLLPAIALMALSQIASADSVQPGFDLTGNWQPGAGGVSSFFQEGTQVTVIYVNAGFAHHFVARYVSPTRFQGIQHRVNRATGCATEMMLIGRATTADSLSISATALDSNCDLVKGQKFTDTNSRLP